MSQSNIMIINSRIPIKVGNAEDKKLFEQVMKAPISVVDKNEIVGNRKQLCLKFLNIGRCDSLFCNFAHNKSEYEPTLCKFDGNCKFKKTCFFLHPSFETKDEYVKRINLGGGKIV